MAIKRLGAQRFAGLATDVASLPIDPDLVGAIFDATDTIQKFVFDGTVWQEFVSGTGEDNTGANVGVGTGTIFRDKIGVTLNFKSLIGGDNITVTDNADDITITSTGTSPLTTKGDLYGFNTVDDRIPVGTDGQVLSANSANPIGVEWIDDVTKTFQPAYQFAAAVGDLVIGEIADNWRVPIAFTNLALVSAYVETAPVGSDISILFLKNGASNSLITISDGALTGSTASFNFSDYTTSDTMGVEIVGIGSTTPGANLKISLIDGVQSNTKSIQFTVTDAGTDIATGLQPDVWRTPTAINTITEISAYVQTAPTGTGPLIVDILKDGVVEGTVTILVGEFTGTTAIINSGFIEFSNQITVDVTQVGSITPGQNLKVSIIGN